MSKLYTLKLEVAHGSDRHDISLYKHEPPTVTDLITELEKKTRVPFSMIQIIFKGQKLHHSPNKPLVQFGIFSGNKVLMIGEKMNPTEDAVFRRILGIAKDVSLIEKSLNQAVSEYALIEQGGVDRSVSKDYVPQLHKRVIGMRRDFEAFLSVISELDLNRSEVPTDVKSHQSQTINNIKENVKRCDSILNKMSKLMDKK